MSNIENYYNPSFMQIYINKNENEFFSKNPEITFFKKTYIAPEIFIKDEISLKSIPMKWDDTTFMKIPKDIHLLGKIWWIIIPVYLAIFLGYKVHLKINENYFKKGIGIITLIAGFKFLLT